MDGFKINYISADGDKAVTWFGMPMASFDVSRLSQKDVVGMVSMMFGNAHPGCEVVSIEPCKHGDFEAMTNN